MNRITLILVLVIAAVIGTAWYIHRAKARALNSGQVFVRQQTPPAGNTKPQGSENPGSNASGSPQNLASNTSDNNQPFPDSQRMTATPASDSIPRNPPNGRVFAGAGKFQLYRQGDITWRLNTETGQACVLLATRNQWSKSLVYEHGCGAS